MDYELTRIEFTGNRQHLLHLDRSSGSSSWARSSQRALRALQSYADAKVTKDFAGNFKMWCETPPPGAYAIPAGKVARDESESVRNNARRSRERKFAVPLELSQSGYVFMGAHIRIGTSGKISPRLYFHDATARTSKIFIGYIGPHLITRR